MPIADWDLYERFLNESANVSGLSYRDPSGAGESIAWGYGARNAVSVIVEVDTMQWSPIETTTIRQALTNELAMYALAWENLELFGGQLEIVSETSDSVKVTNTGWGAAYNVTAGNGVTGKIEPGETKTLKKGSNVLQYLRLVHVGEEEDLTLITIELGNIMEDDGEITPALSPISAIFCLIAVVALRKRK